MDGTRVFAIALLLCLAPIGGAVASDPAGGPLQTDAESDQSMTVVSVANTSEYLAPRPAAVDRVGEQTTGIDVTGAVEADSGQLRSDYLYETFRRQYRNADTDAERRAIIDRGIQRFSERAQDLEARQTETIRRFNEGAVSEYELLRTLATVSREAETTNEALEWLATAANELGVDDVAQQAAAEQVRLAPTDDPVRAQVSRAFETGSTSRVYIETAGDGVVLATVDRTDGTYLRAAYDPTAKRNDIADRYDESPLIALERIEEIYPWVSQNNLGVSAAPIGSPNTRLYRFVIPHPHGELRTYLDSGSEEIVSEFQRNELDRIPSETEETTRNGLRLTVNTTRAGGPLGVSVLDTATDERVDATIGIDGEPVGSTGGQRLWTVAPRGPTTINATHDGQTVTLNTNLG